MSNHGTPGATTPLQIIHISEDNTSDDSPTNNEQNLELDTDSEDGGMQLDLPEGHLLQYVEDDNDIEFDMQMMGNGIETERDETEYTTHAVNPFSSQSNGHNTPAQMDRTDEPTQSSKPNRTRFRGRRTMPEEQYAALAVTNDWELLVSHALNSHRTIPQTRRLFQARMLTSNNPRQEAEYYAARFVVPASRSELISGLTSSGRGGSDIATGVDNSTAYLVPGSYREIIDHDQSGWWGPGGKPRGKRKSERYRGLGTGAPGSPRKGSGESSRVGSRAASRGPGG
ncbi:hypothetical protein N7462_011140 [Penicillium macrosclerotiorum]|uniref:uncharacterized protein n=1 Tax=Penicillium macrosclerotiorum TaxID=303699 RepID=UPI0025481AEB|nr:uncharacterized protein N7462_011140 [Penicillium macrosclerotiorum]KAJ5666731.1 hypothetical protein N7462_011140 [Penicillium macrosclerotiorum]